MISTSAGSAIRNTHEGDLNLDMTVELKLGRLEQERSSLGYDATVPWRGSTSSPRNQLSDQIIGTCENLKWVARTRLCHTLYEEKPS